MENKRGKMYSHSRLSTFEQCPLKFKFRYIDKIIPEIEKSIEAHLGTAVHDTLEWVYTKVIKENQIPSLDDVIVFYSEAWRREFSKDIKIVRENMTAKDYYNKGIEFLINYYTKHQPFNDGTIEIEKKIIVNLDQEGQYKIIGFIDRLAQNLDTGEFEIHDYKTANSLPTQQKMDQDRQLALYAIAIKELHGHDKEVTLNWHYLAHNQKIISKRTNQQLQQLKDDTIQLIKEIEATTSFPPKKSILCKWCEYIDICQKHAPPKPIQEQPHPNNTPQETNILYKDKYPTISKYIKD